jgi:hypothetical protein
MSLRPMHKRMSLPKENLLTQQCHKHTGVNFEFKYLCEFDVICENMSGCETVAKGKTFDNQR